jgi:DNA mismatch repair protein MutS
VRRQWQAATTAGFGFADDDPAVLAAAAVLTYLNETQKTALAHIRPLRRHVVEDHLAIDAGQWRSLEIDRTVRSGGTEGSLLARSTAPAPAMGARLLRQWLRSPRRDASTSTPGSRRWRRCWNRRRIWRDREMLDDICDIERIIGRLAVGRAGPRDLAALGRCLAAAPQLVDRLAALPASPRSRRNWPPCVRSARSSGVSVAGAIKPIPPRTCAKGASSPTASTPSWTAFAQIDTNSQQWLANYQAQLARETGITSLKVGYNKVFGYYIEVTDAHRDKVPPPGRASRPSATPSGTSRRN